MQAGFETLVCADGSKQPRSRAVCVARVSGHLLEPVAPEMGWSVGAVLRLARQLARNDKQVQGRPAEARSAAAPRSLFHVEGVATAAFDCDVTSNGQRFLVRLAPEPEGAAGLRVALEWSRRLNAPAEPH